MNYAPLPPMAYMCIPPTSRMRRKHKKQSQSLPIVQWVVYTHCSFYAMQIAFQIEILHAQSSYTYRYRCCYSDTSSPRDYHYVLIHTWSWTCTTNLYLYHVLVLLVRTCTTCYIPLPVTNKAIPVAQGRERLYQAQHHLGNQCSSLLRSHSQ